MSVKVCILLLVEKQYFAIVNDKSNFVCANVIDFYFPRANFVAGEEQLLNCVLDLPSRLYLFSGDKVVVTKSTSLRILCPKKRFAMKQILMISVEPLSLRILH